MSLIVDASVAVKWFAAEEGSDRAEALLESHEPLIAPDLILAEVSNVMWRKFRRGLLSSDQVTAAVRRLPQYFERLIRIGELVERATELTVTFDHPVYDCFYLALAERAARPRLPLVSADSRLLALLDRHRLIEARRL
jgi:predicted nucleic acid-binding protein